MERLQRRVLLDYLITIWIRSKFTRLLMNTCFSVIFNISEIILANSKYGGKWEISLTILSEHYKNIDCGMLYRKS